MKETIVFEGSEIELKLDIELTHIEDPLSMDDYDFECEFYCNPRKVVKITKMEMKRSADKGYIALIDTKQVGKGSLRCKITAFIPDSYGGNDWARNTVWEGETGYYIQKVKV